MVEGARLDDVQDAQVPRGGRTPGAADVQDAQVPREAGRRERQVCNTFQAVYAMMKT